MKEGQPEKYKVIEDFLIIREGNSINSR